MTCEHGATGPCFVCNPGLAVSPEANLSPDVMARQVRKVERMLDWHAEQRRAAKEEAEAMEARELGIRHYDPRTGEVVPGYANKEEAQRSWQNVQHQFSSDATGLCFRCGRAGWNHS
jgi:hypothetical protein